MAEPIVKNQTINLADYKAHSQNYNKHSGTQIAKLQASLSKFGQVRSIVVWREYIIAGHGLTEAAKRLGWKSLRADVLDSEISESVALAYLVADNELARQSDPDQAALAAILDQVKQADAELLTAAGFSEQELAALLASLEPPTEPVTPEAQIDRAEELQAVWNVQPGDLWQIGPHRLICGDCREPETWRRLMGGKKANGVFTSPPYAMQRKDQYGGVETDKYVDWWEAVQANAKANLATDGSFFVNIKAHCEDGQRVLYCMDLATAMVRRWEWRFVDELYYKTIGIPGLYKGRFRNVIESIYHFSLNKNHKWYARPNGEATGKRKAFGYSATGSGIQSSFEYSGEALPTNCIEIASAATETKDAFNAHSAMFPVALPDFFVRAYSDPGDVWVDCFAGSGTTLLAAHNNNRIGYGMEKLPKYCAVILQRMADATGLTGVRVEA